MVLSLSAKSLSMKVRTRQFTIKERGTITRTHGVGDFVTSYSTVKAVTPDGEVRLLVYGILNGLDVNEVSPYALKGDKITASKPGFESVDPIPYDQVLETIGGKSIQLVLHLFLLNYSLF